LPGKNEVSDKPSFFSELKRRNVYKVAVAYAVVGWLIAQIATQIFPFLEIPNWVVRLVIVLIAIGFPIALVIAWAFEATPQGIKRTEIADAMPSTPAKKRRAWIYVVIVGAAFSIGLFFIGRYTAQRIQTPRQSEAATVSQKSIAVLPFENLSDDKNAAYFADGIQDEILTKLASIADLKVISRTSTAKYKSKPEDLKTVSQQLGVANVLEGSVQKSGDKVRVNVQLIDARADSHLWAKTYDRDLADVFAIQTEVAQEIADSLQAKLSPAEANTVARAPTENTEAYDFFLKGEFEEREAESSLKPEVYDQAASWYRRAIAQDPKFALAIARFVNSRMQRHWFVEPLSEKELEELRQTAQDAVKLAPTLAEAHVSLGIVYYFGHRQYDEALGEFRRAIELQPNNARALEYSGYVHRRQGRWQECLSELSKAEEQDPREAGVPGNFSTSHTQLRMWKEAERYAARSLALNPHTVDGMRALLISYLNGRGDFKGARRLLETFPPDANLLADAAHMTVEGPLGLRAYVSVLEGNYAAALQLFENQSNGLGENARLSARGTVHILAGDAAGARGEMEKARRLVEARLQERPSDLDSMIQLSWIYLGLDRKSDALKLAQRAVDFLPPEKDALVGTFTLYNVAAIKARTGDATGAIDILRRLLAMPAGHEVSVISLKTNPVWAPIRNDPGFQELLTGKELVGPSEQLR
jgi:TolB-like protein/cytochrome c-type biogenesis protein CcmH/NrfG